MCLSQFSALPDPFTWLMLITWTCIALFQEDCGDFEDMSWYNCLVFFGSESNRDIDPEDSDIKIIPSLVEKVVLPKLTCEYHCRTSLPSYFLICNK